MPTETPDLISLTLGTAELVTLPASGELTLRLPGDGLALLVESGARVYLPAEEGQRKQELRQREDLRVKGSSQRICGEAGQQVWALAKLRGQALQGSIARQGEPQLPAPIEDEQPKKINLRKG